MYIYSRGSVYDKLIVVASYFLVPSYPCLQIIFNFTCQELVLSTEFTVLFPLVSVNLLLTDHGETPTSSADFRLVGRLYEIIQVVVRFELETRVLKMNLFATRSIPLQGAEPRKKEKCNGFEPIYEH